MPTPTQLLTGNGPPSDRLGQVGDVYLDTETMSYYGPKEYGLPWPAVDAPAAYATTNFTAATGFPAALRKRVTITAAACLPSSQISVSWRSTLDTDANDPEMDALQFQTVPATGTFDLILTGTGRQKFGGDFTLKYSLS